MGVTASAWGSWATSETVEIVNSGYTFRNTAAVYTCGHEEGKSEGFTVRFAFDDNKVFGEVYIGEMGAPTAKYWANTGIGIYDLTYPYPSNPYGNWEVISENPPISKLTGHWIDGAQPEQTGDFSITMR